MLPILKEKLFVFEEEQEARDLSSLFRIKKKRIPDFIHLVLLCHPSLVGKGTEKEQRIP
jgi:hypothetical protein